MKSTLPWSAGSPAATSLHVAENGQQTTPRSLRWVWLVGLGLLLASAAGTGYILRGSPFNSTNGAEELKAVPPGIVCIGFVDVEPGIAALHPLQAGRVLAVMPEGTEVQKGDVLLRLDHEVADLRVKEAEADLEAAKNNLELARRLPDQYRRKQEQQEAAIEAARRQKAAAEHEAAIKTKLYEGKSISLQEMLITQEMVQRAEAQIKAEESKLAELKQFDPQPAMRSAESAVKAKEAQLRQAQYLRRQCDLLAPSDGKVLRVFVNPGEVLGTNPKLPAVQFCPAGPRIIRAEVLQEWASRVAKDMPVLVEDDTRAGTQWRGKVKSISDWYTQKRIIVLEPMVQNDVRTLECVVEILEGDYQLRIGQRVRVTILEKE